jgi:hypothetical protein
LKSFVSKDDMKIVVTSNNEYKTQITEASKYFMESLVEHKDSPNSKDFLPSSSKQWMVTDQDFIFISICIRTVPFEDENFAVLKLISNMVNSILREKYPSNSIEVSHSIAGYFSIFSQNVVNVEEMLEQLTSFTTIIIENQFFDLQIEDAKKNVLRELHDINAHEKAKSEIFFHLNPEKVKKMEEKLIKIDRSEILRATNEYLIGTPHFETKNNQSQQKFVSKFNMGICVMGKENKIPPSMVNSSVWNILK